MTKLLPRRSNGKRLFGFVLAFMIMIGLGAQINVSQAIQNDQDWSFYLFNDLTNELIMVNADGSQETFDLGLGDLQNPDETTAYLASGLNAFSSDGRLVAYCISQISLDGAPPTFFVVRDIVAETDVLNIEIGMPWGCHVTPNAFGPDDTTVAVGVVTGFPGDPDADPDQPTWYLRVYDVETAEVVNEISANTAPFSEATDDFALMPDVRYFDESQITFAQVPWGTGGAPEYRAFNWHYNDDEVDALDLYGKSSIDTFGGELIYVDYDPNLPAGTPGGPIGQFNVLMLSDKSGQQRMIYHSPEWIIANAYFISNGEQIAMRLLESNPTEVGSTRWIALNRDGRVVDLQPEYIGYDDVMAAPNGYLYIQASFDPDNTLTTVSHYVDGEAMVIFESDEAALRLLWASPTFPSEVLGEFPDFAP